MTIKMSNGYFVPCDENDRATGELWEVHSSNDGVDGVVVQTWNFEDAQKVIRALGELVAPIRPLAADIKTDVGVLLKRGDLPPVFGPVIS
jgi:hypothetical protein